MDYEKIVRNVDILAGFEGVEKLLDCIWCVDDKRDIVLKYIANRYGINVSLKKEKDFKKLPQLADRNTIKLSGSSNDVRVKLARKYKVSPTKVKPAGDGRFIIRGRVVYAKDVLEQDEIS
jgi:hypothetical protein